MIENQFYQWQIKTKIGGCERMAICIALNFSDNRFANSGTRFFRNVPNPLWYQCIKVAKYVQGTFLQSNLKRRKMLIKRKITTLDDQSSEEANGMI